MKIAITATGNTLDSMVDPRFGRAAWFLIIDPDTNTLIEAIDNAAGKKAAHGAGIAAAAQIADKGVKALLTGRVGPKAVPVLEKAGIKAVNNVSGTIIEAIATYSGKPVSDSAAGDNTSGSATAARNCGCGKADRQVRGMGRGQGQCRR